MFTGQIIGYVGADARQNKNGKGFNFHVSTKSAIHKSRLSAKVNIRQTDGLLCNKFMVDY